MATRLVLFWQIFFSLEFIGDVMRRITMMGAVLVLFAGGVTANAQGRWTGVNPSNPQDLSHRSNPQDMTAPGASNPQDMVRQPPAAASSVVTSPKPQSGVTPTAAQDIKKRPKQSLPAHLNMASTTRCNSDTDHHSASLRAFEGPWARGLLWRPITGVRIRCLRLPRN